VIESTEEERLFESCSIHESEAYENLKRKDPFAGVEINMWTNVESVLAENELNLQAVLK